MAWDCLCEIETSLRLNGLDGLCSEDCGCSVEELAPCGGLGLAHCRPAYHDMASNMFFPAHDADGALLCFEVARKAWLESVKATDDE